MKPCLKKLHIVTFVVSLYVLGTVFLPLSLSACVPLSLGKLSTKPHSEDPTQDPEFQQTLQSLRLTCADVEKGLPFRIAYSQSFNQDATLWWRALSREALTLERNSRAEIVTMGAETTLGMPPSIESWLQETIKTRDRDSALKLKSSLVGECMKVADDQTDSLINAVLQFVLGIYDQRYKFSHKDVRKLEGQTTLSVRTSTYFVVRDPLNNAILGTIRAVRAPYGRRYVKAKGGQLVDDHTGDFGPIVAELLPHEAPPRQKRIEAASSGDRQKSPAFPLEDPSGYQYNIKQGPPRFGPDIRFAHFIDRSKPVEHGDFRPLPMELGFKVKLPREAPGTLSTKESNSEFDVYYGAGELIELGNLAIAKNAPDGVWDELFRRLAQWIEILSQTRHVTLWNRTLVPRLFEPLGFSKVGERFESPGTKSIYAMRADADGFVARVRKLIDKHAITQTESEKIRQSSLKEISVDLAEDLAANPLAP